MRLFVGGLKVGVRLAVVSQGLQAEPYVLPYEPFLLRFIPGCFVGPFEES